MASTDALQRKRLRFLLSLFIAVLIALVVFRLGYWMIVKSEWLKNKASAQWIRELPIEPQRGNIEDRNGNILAASVTSDTVVLHPKAIKEEELEDLVNSLNEILGIDKDIIEKKALKTNYSVVWLKRQITQQQSQQIKELNSGGVSLTEDKRRYYPLGSFLTQVLGFTSVDGEGLEGIESRFDNILHGTPGSIVTETDRDGQPLPGVIEEYVDPIEGNNLKLTIDLAIQSYMEKALKKCIDDTGAKSVSAVAMDCNTGEILAISNKPDFDNNAPPRNDMDLLRELTKNNVISYAYEPGNIFGIFSTAAGIDSGKISEGYSYDCEGSFTTHESEVVCWNEGGHGVLNLNEAFKSGCNLTFADIAVNTGMNEIYDYIYKFGFGQKSGIKLYGETQGIVLSPKYVNSDDLAHIGYGQGISVTTLQMAAAFSAVVNGGNYISPYIVKEITTPEGDVLETFSAERYEAVISYATSDIICELLKTSMQDGSGVTSSIYGYELGGFAGSAKKYDSTGTIIPDSHIATFAVAAPIDKPEIVIYIMVEEPEGDIGYGSYAAAPYAKMILEEALPYMSIMTDSEAEQLPTSEMPDLIQLSLSDAKTKLRDKGIKYIIQGNGDVVVAQYPEVGEEINSYSKALILLEDEDDQDEGKKVEIPDLEGLTSIEAYKKLEELGLKIKVKGLGSVVESQFPLYGDEAYEGDIIEVTFYYPPEDETEQSEQGE